MKNKKINKLINNLVDASFIKGKLNNIFIKKTVTRLKNLKSDLAIFALEKYKKGLLRKLNETTLSIESPIKLSPKEIAGIKKSLNSSYTIHDSKFLLNPTILGGLRIKIGDYLLDYSLKNNIKQLGGVISGK